MVKTVLWYIKYTFLSNLLSIATGATLAILILLMLTGYFCPSICALLTLIINGVLFSMLTFNIVDIKKIKESITAKSTLLGGFIGNMWVILLYLTF